MEDYIYYAIQKLNYTVETYVENYVKKIKSENKDEEFFKKIIEEKRKEEDEM